MIRDFRMALRVMRRAPVASAVAVGSIVLSVGAASVVFAAVKAVLLDRLPYAHAEQLIQVRDEYGRASEGTSDWVLWRDTEEIRRRARTVQSSGVYRNALYNLAGDTKTPPEALYGLLVSTDLFPTLGVAPMLGRNLAPEDEAVMILSYAVWQRRFGGDPQIVGRRVKIDGGEIQIVGVMREGFNFPLKRSAVHTPSPYVEFWAPLGRSAGARSGAMGMVARLRPGVTAAQAQEDIASIGSVLSREFPATNRDHTLAAASLRDRMLGNARQALWLVMAAAILFVIIGCANVANLLLVRGLARQREMAIRAALGAARARILRQLLTESCVLAAIGGAGAYGLTLAAWRVLPAMAPVSIPRLAAARADGTVLAFALAAAILNGLLFGIVPAWRAGRADRLNIRYASGGRDRLRGVLVAAEIAITLALVVVGAEFLGSFVDLLGRDPGFDADRVVASVLIPAPQRYRTREQHGLLYRRVLDSVREIPGVDAAATVDALPFSGENHGGTVTADALEIADPRRQSLAEIDVVSAEYLPAIGVRLAAGRWFTEDDMRATADSAIVNDRLAAHLWPGESALGKRICLYCRPENPNNWKRVTGVVSSVRHTGLDEARAPYDVYTADGALDSAQFLVVKSTRPAGEIARAIRQRVAAIDPEQPVFFSVAMSTLVADSIADRRFILTLLAATGLLALAMSVAGVYGVVAYTTSRRTQEIGVRMALGATPGNVLALMFRQGFTQVAAGLAIGLMITAAATRALRGIVAPDPSAIALASALVTVAAAAACWAPARRAARIDPMAALREE